MITLNGVFEALKGITDLPIALIALILEIVSAKQIPFSIVYEHIIMAAMLFSVFAFPDESLQKISVNAA